MLLTVMARRFPFFHSVDDIEAMIEIATIFGARRMKSCALLHGTVFESTIPTIGEKGFSLEKIILWSNCRATNADGTPGTLEADEAQGVRFLERLLELDPRKRLEAYEALDDPFLAEEPEETSADDEEDEMEML